MRPFRLAVVLAVPLFALACGGVDSVTNAPISSDGDDSSSASDGGSAHDGGKHDDAGTASRDGGAGGGSDSATGGGGAGSGGGGGGTGGSGGGTGTGAGIDAGSSGGSTVSTCAELLACCETSSDPSTCEVLASVGDDATCASLGATLCP